jgi:hypothetical protein
MKGKSMEHGRFSLSSPSLGEGDGRAVARYGWKSEGAPCSCGFVAPKVARILKRPGCQSVLDVGAGNGALCGMLHAKGFSMTGAEVDNEGCDIAGKA